MTVPIFGRTDVVYLRHHLADNQVDSVERLGLGIKAEVLLNGADPVVFYLEVERENGIPKLLARRDFRDGKWQPRRPVLQIAAGYMDALKVGNEYYLLCTDGKNSSLNMAVLVLIDGDGKVQVMDLPTESLRGNIEPRLGPIADGVEIYYTLDKHGVPVKKVFSAIELEALRRP